MVALIVQTVLLVAIAFIAGCVAGSLLRTWFGPAKPALADDNSGRTTANISQTEAETAPSAVEVAEPVVPKPPIPVAPVEPETRAKVETPPVPLQQPSKKVAKKPAAKRTRKDPPQAKPATPAAVADNLKLIRGIGPQNEARLNALGINSFAQIAGWSKKDQAHYGEVLAFPGRIEREDWAGQAKRLASGEGTTFSKRMNTGSIKSSRTDEAPTDSGSEPANLLAAPRGGNPDKLTSINGVGSALEKKLNKCGIYHFDQIAGMSEDELTWLGNVLGFPGRPNRENWATEAKGLAAGNTPQTPEKPARGEIKTSRGS